METRTRSALRLAALLWGALVLVLVLGAGPDGPRSVRAGAPVPEVDFSMEVVGAGCSTEVGQPGTCNVPVGGLFTVRVRLDSFANVVDWDGDTVAGYKGFQARLARSAGLAFMDRPGVAEVEGVWPDCGISFEDVGATDYLGFCLIAFGAPESVYTGPVMEADFRCGPAPSVENVTMLHSGQSDTRLFNETGSPVMEQGPAEALTINCLAVDFSIGLQGGGCDTGGASPAVCRADPGATFTVDITLNAFSLPDVDVDGTGGYQGIQARLAYTNELSVQDRTDVTEIVGVWPDCGGGVRAVESSDVGAYAAGCIVGDGAEESVYVGVVMQVDFACSPNPSTGSIVTLLHGAGLDTHVLDESLAPVAELGPDEALTIDCLYAFPWDVNDDGTVSIADIAAVVSAFGQDIPPAPPRTDVNGDGAISVADIAGVVLHFGESPP